jgi:hypothetical protein
MDADEKEIAYRDLGRHPKEQPACNSTTHRRKPAPRGGTQRRLRSLPRHVPVEDWAITSLVLSALALLGVLAVAALVIFVTGPNSSGSGGPLTGQLAASTSGGPVAGTQLSRAVSTRIDQDGGDVTLMNCPDTPKVGQGVVTVCHGVVSSSEYAIVVYFEDEDGRFTLDPL